MKVSVVIATLNRAEQLRATLRGLACQRYRDFEIIVVNGPSNDDTESALEAYAGRIKLGRCDVANLGKARNFGIGLAAGDIVAFLDDDGVPEPDWLTYLIAPYLRPEVGGVGGFIRDNSGVRFQAKVTVCDRSGGNRGFHTMAEAESWVGEHPDQFISLTGCNSSFRRSALLAIGGFDEEFAYFLDETDVCLRVLNAGHKLTVTGLAQVHHKYAPSHLRDDRRVPKSFVALARSAIYYTGRHSLDRSARSLERFVDGYRGDRMREIDWLLHDRLIDQDTAERLRREVQAGIGEALNDLRDYPNGRTRSAEELTTTTPFLRFDRGNDALRLCLVCQDYRGETPGGIAVWTRLVAEGLARRGLEVTVVCRSAGDTNTVDFIDGVWVHSVVDHGSAHRDWRDLPPLPEELHWHCLAVQDEVLRVHSLRGLDIVSFPIWDLEGLPLLRGPIPTVISLHTTYALSLPFKAHWSEDEQYREKHIVKVVAAENWALQQAPALLANSSVIVSDIERVYGIDGVREKSTVLPHGVPDYGATARRRPPGRLQVLYAGRFERRKGIDLLLDVLPGLAIRFPEVEWVLAGNNTMVDGDINHLKAFLQAQRGAPWLSRVSFPGQLGRDELLQAFADCDLFVAPSRYESFGLIFAEAAAFGCPAVGIDAGGVPEVLRDGEGGILVGDDAGQLEEAIALLLNDGEMRQRMGVAARARYEQEFSVTAMLDGLQSWFTAQATALSAKPDQMAE